MKNYIRNAISQLYGEDDDFILIGLTGRTGSGCSTAAKVLSSNKEEIKHTLFSGANPISNDKRKERIILQHFNKHWQPFMTISASAVLTLLMVECEPSHLAAFLSATKIFKGDSKGKRKLHRARDILEEIRKAKKSLEDRSISARDFYSNQLSNLRDELRSSLGETAFIKLYQTIGTNVRKSGNPLDSDQIEGKFFTLAERINAIVKDIRDNRAGSAKTFFVIDAIRNPLEAIYFQDRYSAFFLLAVSCDDEQRKRRLREKGFTDPQIRAIDDQEYSNRDLDEKSTYVVQDIQACLQRADLYINNTDSPNSVSKFHELTNQILKFVSLMKHPGLVTPTALERCMQMAYTAKLNSGCISRQVGAVITDRNFSIQAVGWNDTPYGQVPCNLRSRLDLESGHDQVAYSTFEKTDEDFLKKFRERTIKYIQICESGRNISYCFKSEHNKNTEKDNQVHTRSLHAEENAFLQIAKYGGRGIEGGKLFTTASPCELCSKKAYQLGIEQIFYIDPYPGIAVKHILMSGSKNPELILFSGAIGRAFHRLYTPIVAYKDELTALAE